MSDASPLSQACAEALTPYLKPDLFRALSDATRLALLARLATTPGAATVTELSSCCGVHFSGVSRHLKILESTGLVEAERHGREMRYRLDCASLSQVLRGMADALDECAASCREAACCSPNQGETSDDTSSVGSPGSS